MLHVGGKSKMSQLKSLDWLGIFLFIGGLALFLIVSSNIEFCSAEPRTKCLIANRASTGVEVSIHGRALKYCARL